MVAVLFVINFILMIFCFSLGTICMIEEEYSWAIIDYLLAFLNFIFMISLV